VGQISVSKSKCLEDYIMQPSSVEQEERRIRSRLRTVVVRKADAYQHPWFNLGYVYRVQELERVALAALFRSGHSKRIETLRVLDIGCGTAHWPREFIKWGARPQNVYGIDLIEERVKKARELCPPKVTIECGSALQLSYPDRSFDVVILFLVFCNILETEVRKGIAAEAVRVLKDDGVILWCDYRMKHPRDIECQTVRRRELRGYFPEMRINSRSIHPLPPLLRAVGPRAPFLCNLLGLVPFIRTHTFATIFRR
jgi:SAM-dependent methyltransferase